jgi:hypothetical protein
LCSAAFSFFQENHPSREQRRAERREQVGAHHKKQKQKRNEIFFLCFSLNTVYTILVILYPVKKKLIGKISKYTVNNKYVVSSEGREGGREEEELSINKIFKF